MSDEFINKRECGNILRALRAFVDVCVRVMWVRIYMCARDNNFENIEPFFLTPANIHQLVTLINISIIRFVFALYYDYNQTN